MELLTYLDEYNIDFEEENGTLIVRSILPENLSVGEWVGGCIWMWKKSLTYSIAKIVNGSEVAYSLYMLMGKCK